MRYVYIGGKRVKINPNQTIGKGGEAEIYELAAKVALKLFKQPDHPDFLTSEEQEAAKDRLSEHQTKLLAFPKGLPRRVVTPTAVARSGKGDKAPIVGYTMPFLKGCNLLYDYSRKKFRAGISNQFIVELFRDMHQTLSAIHKLKVVIGDFNDLNILVRGSQPEAYFIDADSFQFGKYKARMFTLRFVDPLLCEADEMQLAHPHNADSDWYAYNIMLMQSLLFVGPYGGIYRPKDKTNRIPHDARPLQRITVFNDNVRYPKPAIHYKVLPDELLHHFHQVFEEDARGAFPAHLLEMRWDSCSKCQLEHARRVCPDCATMVVGAVKQIVVIRGSVKATRLFETTGIVLHAASQGGKLHWIYHEKGQYFRQTNGSKPATLLNGKLDPKIRYRVSGKNSYIAKTGLVIQPTSGERVAVDNFRSIPMFDSNSQKLFYLQNGQLLREDDLGPTHVGNVLTGKTLLWVGERFGFGYYALGTNYEAFVFNTAKRSIVDFTLPHIPGQLIDSTVVFSKKFAWVFFCTQAGGRTYNHCLVVDSTAQVVGMTYVDADDPKDHAWLQQIRGKFAVGNQLYSPTDDGIVRVELESGNFTLKEFPDTEPFVDSSCQLFPDSNGIFVVKQREIIKLQIS